MPPASSSSQPARSSQHWFLALSLLALALTVVVNRVESDWRQLLVAHAELEADFHSERARLEARVTALKESNDSLLDRMNGLELESQPGVEGADPVA